MRTTRAKAWPTGLTDGGAFGTTVGLVSLGQIARHVASLLRQLDVHVLAYDPFCSRETAAELGVDLVKLPELFARSRVVSLHTPSLPATKGLITGQLLGALPTGSTFINTARGAIVCEDELIATLQQRPDLTAVLDVTDPEPPIQSSPLYDLPNVFLTPHVAGSLAGETGRMGAYMVDECRRFLTGESLRWKVTRESFTLMA